MHACTSTAVQAHSQIMARLNRSAKHAAETEECLRDGLNTHTLYIAFQLFIIIEDLYTLPYTVIYTIYNG